MKTRLTIPTCLFILSPNVIFGVSVRSENLVSKEGFYYKKLTDGSFSGTITETEQERIKKVKRDGPWVNYYDNGQLRYKGTYKDGKKNGKWIYYDKSGKKEYGPYSSGMYKDGKKVPD